MSDTATRAQLGNGTVSTPLLEVKDLSVTFFSRGKPVRAVNGLDLSIGRQERVGVVGESGSGKSVTALAILQLLEQAKLEGEILFDGEDLLRASQERMRSVRGSDIGYIFQDPLSALNPVRTIGSQVTERLRTQRVKRSEAVDRAVKILERVGIDDAHRRLKDYPHQFSGGMRQRVMIAMAVVNEPKLLIADEPTTALDVRVQAQVMDLLLDLAEEQHLAILFITHDLGVLAGFAQRVVVMYAGRAVEKCSTDELFYGSIHPYTLGLLRSLPRVDGDPANPLATIGGQPPSPMTLPPGCPFNPRCPYTQDRCRETDPPLVTPENAKHPSACHFAAWLAERPGELR